MGFESQYCFLLSAFDFLIHKTRNVVPAGLGSQTPVCWQGEDRDAAAGVRGLEHGS